MRAIRCQTQPKSLCAIRTTSLPIRHPHSTSPSPIKTPSQNSVYKISDIVMYCAVRTHTCARTQHTHTHTFIQEQEQQHKHKHIQMHTYILHINIYIYTDSHLSICTRTHFQRMYSTCALFVSLYTYLSETYISILVKPR